jgi:hypothetical protein
VIVGTVRMALTLGQWCHGINSWQAGGHIWNPLRDRQTEDFNVRDAIVQTVPDTNSAVNPKCAEMALPKKLRIFLNELSHSCGRVLGRLDGELRSRQSSR